MLITEINGKKVSSLDDFAAAARAVAPGSAGYVVARDLSSTASPIGGRVSELTFNVARYPLQLFAWDQARLDWVVVKGGKSGGGGGKGGAEKGEGAVGAQAASDSGVDVADAVLASSGPPVSASSASPSTKAGGGGGGKPGGRSLLQQNASSSSGSASSSTSPSVSPSSNKSAAADATSGAAPGGTLVDAPKPAVGPGANPEEGGGGGSVGVGGVDVSRDGGKGSSTSSTTSSSSSSAPASPRAASNVWSPEERARLKRGVVSVRASTDIPLGNAIRADASSSGFIASKDDDDGGDKNNSSGGRLIIVTDARADNSPTEYTVFFYDGSSAKARPLFSDYASFLEVDLRDAPAGVEVLPVGSGLGGSVPVGSRLLLVAASEDGTASDQEGTLLVRNSQLQTNINVARNSKAAPVLDSGGKVVAVHASNSDAGTLSFETPVRKREFCFFWFF